MNPSPFKILYYFIQLRIARLRHAHFVSNKLKKSWKKNMLKSPFYREIVIDNKEFPIINKQIFMDNFDQINTRGILKERALEIALRAEETRDFSETIGEISIGLSSGTSGNKGIFLTTVKEREKWVAVVLDRVIGFSFKKRKVAFFLRANSPLYEAVKSKLLQFYFFDIQQSIEQHIPKLQKLEANILVAQPSVLIEIAKYIDKHNLKVQFQKILSVAEVLEEDQKIYMQNVFDQRIDQVYQCTEGFLAHTCKDGNLHFNEDFLKIEKKYLDKDRFHPIITDYFRTTQPVVRYELNDIIHEGKSCSCGMKSTVIKKIEGRSDDVYRFIRDGEEKIVYPDFIRRAIIGSSGEITNFVITRRNEFHFDLALEMKDSAKESEIFEKVETALRNVFYGIQEIHINRVVYVHDSMNKFRRVRNEYK